MRLISEIKLLAMGNYCEHLSPNNTLALNLITDIEMRESPKISSREYSEHPLVQPVSVFQTNKTRLISPSEMSSTRLVGSSRQRRQTKHCSDACLHEIKFKRLALPRVPLSQTLKNTTRQSIALEASRFRLEQKASVWSKYEFMKVLGKGSFGEVQMIRNKESKVLRALKIIPKSDCNSSENYLEEIKILQQLVSPRRNNRTTRTCLDCTSSTRTTAVCT